jgi:hypothetical protein
VSTTPTGDTIITDTSTAATRTVDVGVEGVDPAVGDLGPDEEMTREQIFEKYPFLAPEGYGADVTDDYAQTEVRSFADLVKARDPYAGGAFEDDPMFAGSPYMGGAFEDDPMFADSPDAQQLRDSRIAGYTAGYTPGYRVGDVNQGVPRPGAQPSTMQPWERTKGRLTQAYDPSINAYGPDVVRTSIDVGNIADPMFADTYIPSAEEQDILGATRPEPIDLSAPNYYGAEGAYRRIIPDVAEQMYSPFEFEESAPFTPTPVPTPAPTVAPVGVGAPVVDPEMMAGRWYDEGARGIRTGSRPTLVGESGPELALFPNGTEIVPLDRRMRPSQARRLRRRGIRGMQEGGIVFGPDQYRARGGDAGVRSLPGYQGTDKFITSETLSGLQGGTLRQDPKDLSRIYDPNAPAPTPELPRPTASSVYDSPLPLGIRRLQAGRSLGAPRGQLLRTAGIALPSAQARRRMLPSEREAFQGLGRMAGIPAGEFQQELGITTPSGAPRTGSARMLPLSLRR